MFWGCKKEEKKGCPAQLNMHAPKIQQSESVQCDTVAPGLVQFNSAVMAVTVFIRVSKVSGVYEVAWRGRESQTVEAP